MPSKLRPSCEHLLGVSEPGEGQRGRTPLQFLEDRLTLNQSGVRLCPPHKTTLPPRFPNLLTAQFALSWVIILTLGTAIFMFGRKGWDGHALLVEPSKSHRGIAKIFAQVNSLQKIIV